MRKIPATGITELNEFLNTEERAGDTVQWQCMYLACVRRPWVQHPAPQKQNKSTTTIHSEKKQKFYRTVKNHEHTIQAHIQNTESGPFPGTTVEV